jgi:hypothetical protein
MAITRAQIPEQIDVFQEGGEVSATDISLAELADLIKRKQDFETNKARYEQRLGSLVEPTKRMNIFDLASELGKGLAATPNVGGISTYTGLAAGFNNIIEEAKRREETGRQERQQVAMKALELAMEDERLAEKYLNEYNMEVIKNSNKKVPYVTIDYVDANGAQQTTRIADTNANAEEINDYIANYQGKIVEPIKITKEIGGATPVDEVILKNIGDSVKAYGEKAQAAKATVDQVGVARNLHEKLGPENFGPTQRAFLGVRELAVELGLEKYFDIDPTDEGMKKALNQLSMSFTMGIVSQTKGAISDREMKLFISASPTLGSTYEGFQEQLRLLDKLAQRDLQFYNEYLKVIQKANEEGKNATDIASLTAEFELNFQKNFPLFDENDEKLIKDAIANENALADDFDKDGFEAEINAQKADEAKKGGVSNKNTSDFSGEEKAMYEKWLASNPNATEEEKALALEIIVGNQ